MPSYANVSVSCNSRSANVHNALVLV